MWALRRTVFTCSCFRLACSIFKGAKQKESIASYEAFGTIRIPRPLYKAWTVESCSCCLEAGWALSAVGAHSERWHRGCLGTSKQVGWEGDKKEKRKEPGTERWKGCSSVAAVLCIPPGAISRDWDISGTPRGLRCSAGAASTGRRVALSNGWGFQTRLSPLTVA